jgi:hypothetical protein
LFILLLYSFSYLRKLSSSLASSLDFSIPIIITTALTCLIYVI